MMEKYPAVHVVHSLNDLPARIKGALGTANVFYTEDYAKFIEVNGGKPAYLFSDQFVLLAVVNSRFGAFNYAYLPVEYISVAVAGPGCAQAFLDECMIVMREQLHIHWTTPTFASAFFLTCPTASLRIPFGSFVVDLCQEESMLWSKVHCKHRNSIRRAEKSGVEIRFGSSELLADYIALDGMMSKRDGKAASVQALTCRRLVDTCPKRVLIAVAYSHGVPQGGAFFLFNSAMSYYLYAASRGDIEAGSMNLLHWRTMMHLRTLGVRNYSFVGCRLREDADSKYHGIQRFKERFGGKLVVGYMFKVVNSSSRLWVYNSLLRLRSGSKWLDPVDQEIHKWAEINRAGSAGILDLTRQLLEAESR